MTQTARLSGPFLYGPTDLSCNLATVTHGWGETEERGSVGLGVDMALGDRVP